MELTMASYMFRFFSSEGFVYETHHECPDDLDALDCAKTFCKNLDVDVWCADRRVGRVKRGDAPLTVHDRLCL
jgi:hypothetical protein